MRWKAYHFLNNTSPKQEEYYGFALMHPPFIKQMSAFELDLIGLIENTTFKNIKHNLIKSIYKS